MRVNDAVVRYMTVRVDLDRRRAEKFKARRARKAEKRPSTIRVSKEEREAVSEE
jgi:hypothetical protein